ncbi:hypothetical protein V1514DRAFT_293020 [Lipomyces japonicus]|uniref:uncharacterized protein n=1 Tax=Lipomyces japonicus TaxID=56871 RepID=UPI0034CF31C1
MSEKRKADPRQNSFKRAKADPPQTKQNTAIYITNLPADVTFEELDETVSRYGIIAEDITTGKKRIKIYTDENGKPKGDALVIFFRAESVRLAVDMLDDSDLRIGQSGSEQRGTIKVQPASQDYKVEKEAVPMQQRTAKEKKEILKSVQRLNNKLADWDDDDIPKESNKKWNKIVVLKHVFTLKELEQDVAASLDIKQDIREGCEQVGPVTNVVLYDLEEDGVITVRFKSADDAEVCVQRMNGRFFNGQRLKAFIFDGNERYRKSGKKDLTEEDDDKIEQERLQKFGDWLEEYNDDE